MNQPGIASTLWRTVALILSITPVTPRGALERIVVAPDGKRFVTAQSRQPFVPWGANYGNAGRLVEDFWDRDWETLAGDFRKLKEMGANVVRVHLQFGKFMTSPDQPNPKSLKQLGRLLKLAKANGLYLDLTGLACYRPADTPRWYDALAEGRRWTAQAHFWSAVAQTCKGSTAVFCYDLISEPISPGANAKPASGVLVICLAITISYNSSPSNLRAGNGRTLPERGFNE